MGVCAMNCSTRRFSLRLVMCARFWRSGRMTTIPSDRTARSATYRQLFLRNSALPQCNGTGRCATPRAPRPVAPPSPQGSNKSLDETRGPAHSRAERVSCAPVLHGATLDPNQKMSKTADRGQRGEVAGNSQVRKIESSLCVMLVGLRGKKFVMRTPTRFPFTLARLLLGGYMFGACVLVANAQAQKPLYTPGPPVPTAPGSNVPPPVPTAPGSSVPPSTPTAPESSVPPPVNGPPSAARTHERRSVAKTVHHRRRSIVAAWTPPYYWRGYRDPSGAFLLVFCPTWNYPYDPDRCQWRWIGGFSGP